MVTVLGNGVYGYREAALLTGVAPERVREWFRNRPAGGRRSPIFRGDYEPIDGDRAISFLDLIDVFVAGNLRSHGVSLQTLRKVYRRMGDDLDTPHPFCRRELLSDGKTVFMRGLDHQGETELKEALTHQKVFSDIILPFLKKIEYSKISRLAERWHITPHVVIDPKICFGKPVVEAVSIPTAILANAYRANHKNARRVAEWYNVQPEHVDAAVEFETIMAA
jgi:uncharacterized protein (DUF433 family)